MQSVKQLGSNDPELAYDCRIMFEIPNFSQTLSKAAHITQHFQYTRINYFPYSVVFHPSYKRAQLNHSWKCFTSAALIGTKNH